MAQVNYWEIQEAIKLQLENSFSTVTDPASVPKVEIEPIDDPDGLVPYVGVFLDRTEREVRRIGGPTPHQVKSFFNIECLQFDINEFKNACEKRDALVSQVEETLLLNRFLPMSGTNRSNDLIISGIELDTGDTDDGFFARGIILLETEVIG